MNAGCSDTDDRLELEGIWPEEIEATKKRDIRFSFSWITGCHLHTPIWRGITEMLDERGA